MGSRRRVVVVTYCGAVVLLWAERLLKNTCPLYLARMPIRKCENVDELLGINFGLGRGRFGCFSLPLLTDGSSTNCISQCAKMSIAVFLIDSAYLTNIPLQCTP